MNMRELINLLEAPWPPVPQTDQPADRFIQVAHQALANVHGKVPVGLIKTGPHSVAITDSMNGVRTQRHWDIIKTLSRLAHQNGIKMNVSGGAGRFPWR